MSRQHYPGIRKAIGAARSAVACQAETIWWKWRKCDTTLMQDTHICSVRAQRNINAPNSLYTGFVPCRTYRTGLALNTLLRTSVSHFESDEDRGTNSTRQPLRYIPNGTAGGDALPGQCEAVALRRQGLARAVGHRPLSRLPAPAGSTLCRPLRGAVAQRLPFQAKRLRSKSFERRSTRTTLVREARRWPRSGATGAASRDHA
jgi:hypothetical protein